MFERRLEEAGLNSWPALQHLLYDGWLVRFAQGYTKRANSVTPLYPSLLPVEEKVTWCERLYQKQSLPAIFRLLSFSGESLYLDQLLAGRGYAALDRTSVWSLRLPSASALVSENSALSVITLSDWLLIYGQWSTRYSGLEHVHRALLERIASPVLYGAFSQQGAYVACGLGVLEYDVFGLFDIVTNPEYRRKGFGTQLVTGMLDWGQQHGAQYAYLQVVDTNHAARQMYRKLGFQESYQYWYRLRTF
jgi:GNAT superfamily N-acetyltransferase